MKTDLRGQFLRRPQHLDRCLACSYAQVVLVRGQRRGACSRPAALSDTADRRSCPRTGWGDVRKGLRRGPSSRGSEGGKMKGRNPDVLKERTPFKMN